VVLERDGKERADELLSDGQARAARRSSARATWPADLPCFAVPQ
jgi:hypothetical protein